VNSTCSRLLLSRTKTFRGGSGCKVPTPVTIWTVSIWKKVVGFNFKLVIVSCDVIVNSFGVTRGSGVKDLDRFALEGLREQIETPTSQKTVNCALVSLCLLDEPVGIDVCV
jgi:hypothetical protein